MADRSLLDVLNQEVSYANRDSDDDFDDFSGNTSDSEFVPSDSETSEEEGDEIASSDHEKDTQSGSDSDEGIVVRADANTVLEQGPFRGKDGTEWNRNSPAPTRAQRHNIVRGRIGLGWVCWVQSSATSSLAYDRSFIFAKKSKFLMAIASLLQHILA